jgi:hypothetical protein
MSVAVVMVAMLVTGLRMATALNISGYCPTQWAARKPPHDGFDGVDDILHINVTDMSG